MMPKQKSSKKKVICCFVLGIVVMSIVCFYNFEVLNVSYLTVLIVYFIRFLYINREESKDINRIKR